MRNLEAALIREMEKALHTDLSGYTSLRDDLYCHLRPMLLRVEQNIRTENPQLDTIRTAYPSLWRATRTACDAVQQQFVLPAISDDEAAYLAMHFGAALEQNAMFRLRLRVVVACPLGMGSSRFPGKPLALIHGVPMVGHVAFRTAMSRCLSATYVATCDTVIEDYCKEAGLACVMTGDHHVRCSTRTAEALLKIEAATGRKADIVVMVQGDEPMVLPGMIDAAVEPMLKDPTINVVNLMADMDTLEEFEDPNEVKVVVDRNSDALYFSREPIPSRKKGADKVPMRKQVCIIPFRRDYLIRFNEMEESPLEICESVDMMRILEHGEKVRMVPTDARTWSVDTPEDLARVTRLMEGDALMREYAK